MLHDSKNFAKVKNYFKMLKMLQNSKKLKMSQNKNVAKVEECHKAKLTENKKDVFNGGIFHDNRKGYLKISAFFISNCTKNLLKMILHDLSLMKICL